MIITMKWVNCKTCKWNSDEFRESLCDNCAVINEKSSTCYWMNDKINNAIVDICIKEGWKEFSSEEMYKELLKSDVLLEKV